MKKTIVKVLTAALVITTLVCTAAGCGSKSGTANTSSQAGTESTVSSEVSTKESSVIEIAESTTEAEIRSADLDALTESMITKAYYGDDTTGQFSALYIGVDDGKDSNGCAVMFVTTKLTDNESLAGVMNGAVLPVSEKANDDGTKVTVFTVCEPRGMRDTITLTSAADGKTATMSFEGGPYVLNVKPVDSKTAFEKTQEMKKLLESFTAGADRTTQQSDAATVDAACKNYYSVILSGQLNAENNENVKSDVLPAANASEDEKLEAAKKCTVKGAMEYVGIIDFGEYSVSLEDLRADGAGTIFFKDDEVYSAVVEEITEATTFGELYGNN